MNFKLWQRIFAITCVTLIAGCASPRETKEDSNSQTNTSRESTTANSNQIAPNQPTPTTQHTKTTEITPTPTATSTNKPNLVEVFPAVFIDREKKIIILRGTVPIQAKSTDGKPVKPVYLETLVCSHDTKEHESLVVVNARPSHVHAALLMLGLEPGKVGTWREENGKVIGSPATGPKLNIKVRWKSGEQNIEAQITSWAIDQSTQKDLLASDSGSLVFAGSQFTQVPSRTSPNTTFEAYMADIDGTLIGLATFSSECIAWNRMHHHQSKIEEPRWIANTALVPPYGTPVEVVITPTQ